MAINVKNKLVTLESLGVAYSAEQEAREDADQALSTRIDNIVAPDGDPSLTEVSDARVSGSTTYNTLKARLDADKAAIGTEISQLSADLGAQTGIISKMKGYYINLTTDPVNLTPVASTSSTFACAVVDCTAGDKFIVNGRGASLGRAWGFVDSANHVLSMADANATVEDLELTAPINAVKLVLNDGDGGMSYKVGNNLASKMGSGLSDDAKAALLECIRHIARWDDANGRTYYGALYEALYGVPFISPVFRYVPADGLLSAQAYVINYTINTGASESIANGKLRLFAERETNSASSAYAIFNFGEYNETYGRIKIKAKLSATKYRSIDGKSASLRVEVSDTTHGAQFYVYRKSNGLICVAYIVGSEVTEIDTNIDANVYHEFEFIADGNTQKLIIDGTTIVNATGLSTRYVGGIRLWAMSGETSTNITIDIDSIEYYEEA